MGAYNDVNSQYLLGDIPMPSITVLEKVKEAVIEVIATQLGADWRYERGKDLPLPVFSGPVRALIAQGSRACDLCAA